MTKLWYGRLGVRRNIQGPYYIRFVASLQASVASHWCTCTSFTSASWSSQQQPARCRLIYPAHLLSSTTLHQPRSTVHDDAPSTEVRPRDKWSDYLLLPMNSFAPIDIVKEAAPWFERERRRHGNNGRRNVLVFLLKTTLRWTLGKRLMHLSNAVRSCLPMAWKVDAMCMAEATVRPSIFC